MRQYSIILLVAALFGCQRDKVDLDLLKNITLSPEMEVPLINASLRLGDLVENDTNFTVHPDESISISYNNPNLFTYKALDLVSIPDQDPVELPLYTSAPVFDVNMDLGTIGGVELQTASFTKGYNILRLSAASAVSADVKVKLRIKNANRQGQPLESVITMKAGTSQAVDTMLLSQSVFDFSDGNTTFNKFGLRAEIIDPGNLGAGEKLSLFSELKSLEFSNVQGFFGQRNIKIPNGNLLLELDVLREFADGLVFTDPQLKLTATSTMGLGVGLAPDLKGVNKEGKVTALDTSTYILNAATSVNAPEQLLIELNSSNSNIVDFLEAVPNNLLYSGKIGLNPQGRSANFIDQNSELKMGVEINVPLELSINNMRLVKRLNVDFFSKNPEEVSSGALMFRSHNGFPFDLDMSVAILDQETGDSIHGFVLPLLRTAQVDADGVVTNPTRSDLVSIEITEDMLNALTRSNKMKFVAKLNSPENGQKAVKFLTSHFLEISIAAKAKMNIKP